MSYLSDRAQTLLEEVEQNQRMSSLLSSIRQRITNMKGPVETALDAAESTIRNPRATAAQKAQAIVVVINVANGEAP